MIAWTSPTEALGYAEARLTDAVDAIPKAAAADGMALCLAAVADAVAALVMVSHHRKGDLLVTIDQLATEAAQLNQAQPGGRPCCQTYPAEPHARGCLAHRHPAQLRTDAPRRDR